MVTPNRPESDGHQKEFRRPMRSIASIRRSPVNLRADVDPISMVFVAAISQGARLWCRKKGRFRGDRGVGEVFGSRKRGPG